MQAVERSVASQNDYAPTTSFPNEADFESVVSVRMFCRHVAKLHPKTVSGLPRKCSSLSSDRRPFSDLEQAKAQVLYFEKKGSAADKKLRGLR